MILTEIIDNKKTEIYCFEKYSKKDFNKIKKEGIGIVIQEISEFQYGVADHIVGIPKGFQGLLHIHAVDLENPRTGIDYYFFQKKTIDSIMKKLHIENFEDYDNAMGKHIQKYSGSIGTIGFSIH